MKIVAYQVLKCYSDRDLCKSVTEQLAGGWQPFGGVCVWHDGSRTVYAQAMVKYDDE